MDWFKAVARPGFSLLLATGCTWLVTDFQNSGQRKDGDALVGDPASGADGFGEGDPFLAVPPLITTQPEDLTVQNSAAATFFITASSASPMSYQWHQNEQVIPNERSSTLSIYPARWPQHDQLDFVCSVNNDNGTTDSNPARLTVVPDRVAQDLIVLYRFANESLSNIVHDQSGVGIPLNLTIDDPTGVIWITGGGLEITKKNMIHSNVAASKISEAVMVSDQLTVEAWIKPRSKTQTGPARIVTLSENHIYRNFTVGQLTHTENDLIECYEFRVRRSAQSYNGIPAAYTANETATLKLTHVVFTWVGSPVSRLRGYLNGALVVDMPEDTSGDTTTWSNSYELGLGDEFSYPDPSRHWLGELHLVAVYSRALSDTEVLQNFAAGLQ